MFLIKIYAILLDNDLKNLQNSVWKQRKGNAFLPNVVEVLLPLTVVCVSDRAEDVALLVVVVWLLLAVLQLLS